MSKWKIISLVSGLLLAGVIIVGCFDEGIKHRSSVCSGCREHGAVK